MVFETGMFSAALSISGERFSTEMENRVHQFDSRFEDTFTLKEKVGLISLFALSLICYFFLSRDSLRKKWSLLELPSVI